ncbi:MAG: 3-hydroxyacyl-CoA dehydrogenase family protein [Candidatus Syntropharchaeia archaeon]
MEIKKICVVGSSEIKDILSKSFDVSFSEIEGAKEAVKDVDLVIDSVQNDIEEKKKFFSEIDEVCGENTIFACNTSELSITEIAAKTKRPDKFIGMHFFDPVEETKLVELILGEETSDETFESVKGVVDKIERIGVRLNESPLAIMNRVIVSIINEACFVVMGGLASIEDVDRAMTLGVNHPKGPFQMADEIGLDTCLRWLELLYKEHGDPKYRPCPLLRKKVRAGHLGKKVGRGFYTY